jgi:hypothetical protein
MVYAVAEGGLLAEVATEETVQCLHRESDIAKVSRNEQS